MQASPFAYHFAPNTREQAVFMPYKVLPLQLLQLVIRGVQQQNDGSVWLRRTAIRPNQTIEELALDRFRFASPGLTIEENRLAINFGK